MVRLAVQGQALILRGALATVVCGRVWTAPLAAVVRVEMLRLYSGSVLVEDGVHGPVRPVILTPEAVVEKLARRTVLRVRRAPRDRRTVVLAFSAAGVLAAPADQRDLRMAVHPTEQAEASRSGLTLDTWPFPLQPGQRRARPADRLPAFWADGRPCSVGCRPPGALDGWPLRPFHSQHAIRAGLNELRPSNFHVGIDIEARDHQDVYAMSSGPARILAASGPDERVQVGHLIYWHIHHVVAEGQYVQAYRTVVGWVKQRFRHVHLSDVWNGTYLNPLRPGGRVLSPWGDSEPPVIGRPQLYSGGRIAVSAFDPQSFVAPSYYVTPVLAPAALAWRLWSASGQALTPLEFAIRGSQHIVPDSLRNVVYAPGARNPGYHCFALRRLCVPRWRYRLAGGLTPPLPPLRPGRRYRLSIYAWDWAGNESARDTWLTARASSAMTRDLDTAPFDGRPRPAFDFD